MCFTYNVCSRQIFPCFVRVLFVLFCLVCVSLLLVVLCVNVYFVLVCFSCVVVTFGSLEWLINVV